MRDAESKGFRSIEDGKDRYVCCWRRNVNVRVGSRRVQGSECDERLDSASVSDKHLNSGGKDEIRRIVVVAVEEGAAMAVQAALRSVRGKSSSASSGTDIVVTGTLLMDEGNNWDEVRISGPSIGDRCTYMYCNESMTNNGGHTVQSCSSTADEIIVCSPHKMSTSTTAIWAKAILEVTEPDELLILVLGPCASDYEMAMTDVTDVKGFSNKTYESNERFCKVMADIEPLDVGSAVLPNGVNELLNCCQCSTACTILYSSYSPVALAKCAALLYPSASLLNKVASSVAENFVVLPDREFKSNVDTIISRSIDRNISQDALYT